MIQAKQELLQALQATLDALAPGAAPPAAFDTACGDAVFAEDAAALDDAPARRL